LQMSGDITVAERVGFEPTEACTSHAFEACPFGRSGTSPSSEASGIPVRSRPEERPPVRDTPLKIGSRWSDTLRHSIVQRDHRHAEPNHERHERREGGIS
jgi:hypothetical protein